MCFDVSSVEFPRHLCATNACVSCCQCSWTKYLYRYFVQELSIYRYKYRYTDESRNIRPRGSLHRRLIYMAAVPLLHIPTTHSTTMKFVLPSIHPPPVFGILNEVVSIMSLIFIRTRDRDIWRHHCLRSGVNASMQTVVMYFTIIT
jgi:hypothetical protein